MIPLDCKACDHRHYINGEYVRDCYSLCPDYQERMKKNRDMKAAKKKARAIDDYVVKTSRKLKKMRE